MKKIKDAFVWTMIVVSVIGFAAIYYADSIGYFIV